MAKKAQKMEIGHDLVTDYTGPFTTAEGELLSNYMEIEPEAPVVDTAPVVEPEAPAVEEVVEAAPTVEETPVVTVTPEPEVVVQETITVASTPVAIPVRLVGRVKG